MSSLQTRKRKRRRGIVSDWVLVLQQSRSSKKLRQHSNETLFPGTLRTSSSAPRSVPNQPKQEGCDINEGHTSQYAKYRNQMETTSNTEHRGSSESSKEQEEGDLYSPRGPQTFSPLNPVLDGSADDESDRADDPITFDHFDCDYDLRRTSGGENRSKHNQDDGNVAMQDIAVQGQEQHPASDQSHPDQGPFTAAESLRRRPDMHELTRVRRMWESNLNLTGLMCVVGSVRFKVQQYEFMRNIMNEKSNSDGMPSYSRAHRYFEELISVTFPKSVIVDLPKKKLHKMQELLDSDSSSESSQPSSTEIISISGSGRDLAGATEKVRVFLPSSWAKFDVSTPTVFEAMFPSLAGRSDTDETIPLELSKLLTAKDTVISACSHVFATEGDEERYCTVGTALRVSALGLPPRFPTAAAIHYIEAGFSFTGIITATWCVGCDGVTNASAERAVSGLNNTLQCSVIKALSTAYAPNGDAEEERHRVLPGDICAMLKWRSGDPEGLLPVIVYRFWRYEDGISSRFVVWLRGAGEKSATGSSETPERIISQNDVTDIQIVQRSPASSDSVEPAKSHGKLVNGKQYVIYRVLLYCDDFQKSTQLNAKGSAGGCYFLPMSLTPEHRRSASAVRIISLTPQGVSTNEVLRFIVPDLVNSATEGIAGHTPKGDPVQIFIDILGFIGDYPAASGSIDTIGHTGRTPCTLCTFKRLHVSEAQGSRYGYTTEVHCNNSSFLRHGERHTSIRRSALPDEDAKRLGMISNSKVNEGECPLLYLQRTLLSRRHFIPVTREGNLVHPGLFDAYRSNFVAPDHLLTGLAKNVLNVVYRSLTSQDLRASFDISICSALKENGLLPQNAVFNAEKRNLHSMSLSELYCVLLVSVPVVTVLISNTPGIQMVTRAVQLLTNLQKLVAFTFWWPRQELDGAPAVMLVRHEQQAFCSELKSMSKNYVDMVDRFCRDFPAFRKDLDKPNLHRLIELYEHSVPAFGHAREFMELVFESAHQPLKRCIARSNNRDPHLAAVRHCVGNDWQGRLATLYSEVNDADSPEATLLARRGLRRLLLGEEAELLHEDEDMEYIQETDKILQQQFPLALQKQFQKRDRISNFCVQRSSVWNARGMVTMRSLAASVGINVNTITDVVSYSQRWIDALYPYSTCENHRDKELRLFRSARRVRITTRDRPVGRTAKFDSVTANCIVQVYLDPQNKGKRVLKSSIRDDSKLCFFAILAILQREGDAAWAICQKCSTSGGCIQVIQVINSESFQVLQLTSDVRRIALYHICEPRGPPGGQRNRCRIDTAGRIVRHFPSVLNRGRMYFQRRVNGYPPRMA